MTVTRTFLAWQRVGLAAALTGAPTAGAARASIPLEVRLHGTDRSAEVPVQMLGPGDVAAVDPGQIRRAEPYDGCADFESAYLPYVELVDADLPWRFSPVGAVTTPLPDPEHPGAAPAVQQYVKPWMALVAVPADAAQITPPAQAGALPVLTCDGGQLPDPAETWAWAHVNVSSTDGQDVGSALTDPTRSCARLLCPRLLAPGTAYLACVVPTVAAGLHPGSAPPPGTDPLAPAW